MSRAPVRVLSIVSSLCFGGAEKHAVALLNQLDLQRFDLYLACLKPDEVLLPQLNVARLRATLSLDVRAKLDWRAIGRLARFIEHHEIDVVLCTNEYPALYALLAGGRAPRPPKLIEVFHTTLYVALKHRIQMQLYRHVFRRFDLLVYVSHNQRAYWRAKGLRAARDTVVHNGIDVDLFQDRYIPEDKLRLRARLGLTSADYVIGICAALRPEKAHGDFLRALAAIRSSNPRAKGLIIGDGAERQRIEATIHDLGLDEAVHITGFQADVRPFIACTDVMVLSSRAIETFSVAALEAMALGKPTVLTRIGGADEQVTDTVDGLLFEPGDIDALVMHLTHLGTESVRTAIGQAATRKVREHFSEQKMVASFATQIAAVAS